MEITLHDKKVKIDNFNLVPNEWIWDDNLTDSDKIKLMKLYWRYDFFRSVAYKSAQDNNKPKIKATNYMYETQDAYAELLGIPRNKVSSLFKKLEDGGHIARVKGGTQKMVDGVLENVPRDYIVVLNKMHKDYQKDLDDVWMVLSSRLNSLEDKGKQNQKTYHQMLTSYKTLFKDRPRWVKSKDVIEDEVNFGIVSDCDISCPPDYELPPIYAYEDNYEPVDIVFDEDEFNHDFINDFYYDVIDPPF